MGEFIVPMSVDYVDHWDAFHVVRELRQNAMDEDPERYRVYRDHDDLVVRDWGQGLQLRHLFFGVGDKGEEARGQFREGLPLALLVLTRLSYVARIDSGQLTIWNEPHLEEGECLWKICWAERDEWFDGTRVVVPNWFHEYGMYEERFIGRDDPRVIYSDEGVGQILNMEVSAVFCKDIWVRDFGANQSNGRMGLHFGYNLYNIEMNRDRGMIDLDNVRGQIGYLWSRVGDEQLLIELLEAVKEGLDETQTGPWYVGLRYPIKWLTAWKAVHGEKAVLWTSNEASREARWRGATVVAMPQSYAVALDGIVQTDRQYVMANQALDYAIVPTSHLEPNEQLIMRGLIRAAKRIGPRYTVRAAIFEDKYCAGKALYLEKRVLIARRCLMGRTDALSTLIHELAHLEYGASDMTAQFIESVQMIGAKLARRYLWR